jgi:hypothetical protein
MSENLTKEHEQEGGRNWSLVIPSLVIFHFDRWKDRRQTRAARNEKRILNPELSGPSIQLSTRAGDFKRLSRPAFLRFWHCRCWDESYGGHNQED